jgi:amino acid transporter
MPHSGGYIVWVHNAFGPALALLNGMGNLLCNVFDCALYPLLLAQYVERALYPLLPPEPHGAHGASWWRELAPDVIGSCLRLAVVALAAGVNVLGTSVVGIGMVAFMFLVSPPLLALVLASYAAPHTAPLAPFTPSLQEPPTTAAQWHFLLALVMWNNCGYVSAAAWSPPLAGTCSLRRPRPLHTGTTRRAWSPPRFRTLRVPSRAP